MNILIVTPAFPPRSFGGITAVSYNLSKKLAELGNEVTVYTTDVGNGKSSRLKNCAKFVEGMEVHYFKNISNRIAFEQGIYSPLGMASSVKKNIKNFDVIHIHDFRSFMSMIIHHYAKKNGIPYIIHPHGSVPAVGKKKLKMLFDKFWGKKILDDSARVIAGSNAESKQFIERGVEKNRIEIIPNAINISQFENIPKGMFRRKYGIKESDKIILYLGRINQVKGVDFLLNSFRELRAQYDNLKLVLIGPDSGFLSKVRTQMSEMGEDKIVYTGFVPEKIKLEAYADADIYVLPSIYDNFPITVLEALASALPVIVTNHCVIADIVDEVGRVVDYNIASLNEAIIDFLDDDELRLISGKKGHSLIKSKFTYEKIGKQFEELYNSLNGGNFCQLEQ